MEGKLFLILLLIFLVGCAEEIEVEEFDEVEETTEEPEHTVIEERVVVEEPEEIDVPETKPEDEVQVIYTTEPAEIPVAIGTEEETNTIYTKEFGSKEQKLYDKHKKVKGYSYFDMQPFKDPANNKVFGMYHVKGDLIKVEFYDTTMQFPDTVHKSNLGLSEGIFFGPDYYNIVLINTRTKNASGFCLRLECDDYGKRFDVAYDLYLHKSPYEYITEIHNMEIIEERQVDNRFIQIVRSTFDNGERILWLDKFYGMPIKVEEYMDGEENIYEFKAMSFTQEDYNAFMYPFGKSPVK